MPLTPADIHNMAFKKPPIGKRGYDEEEVDAFLDEVEQELIRLLEDNGALHEQIARGGNGGPSPAASTMVINSEFSDTAARLERMQEARARAEQNARSVQAQLEQARSAMSAAPAAPPVDDDRNARVLAMAQRTADDHMRDARDESEKLMADAKVRSENTTTEARTRAAQIEADARRNHTEAMNSLESKRAALIDEIDRLGQLAQSYQSALDNHISAQLMELNSVSKLP